MIIGAINGSDLLNDPIATIFKPFTDLLGTPFYLIPISFLCVAIYLKTKDIVTVSAVMILSGSMLTAGGLWVGYMDAAIVYIIFTGLGITGLIMGILFMRK